MLHFWGIGSYIHRAAQYVMIRVQLLSHLPNRIQDLKWLGRGCDRADVSGVSMCWCNPDSSKDDKNRVTSVLCGVSMWMLKSPRRTSRDAQVVSSSRRSGNSSRKSAVLINAFLVEGGGRLMQAKHMFFAESVTQASSNVWCFVSCSCIHPRSTCSGSFEKLQWYHHERHHLYVLNL